MRFGLDFTIAVHAMFLLRGPGALCFRRHNGVSLRNLAPRSLTTKSYAPLRILFCGSDDFSIASLKALHEEHVNRPDRIASIEVACRPGKRFGRGLKKIREVPVKAAAEQLSLPIHEIDTFKGWKLPMSHGDPINLIVAVSFGLFVPPRLLNEARYGGLNVHPSLLPDFRGPAPLHHTLLAGRTRTGVTLQTLDPVAFDHGVILDQTPSPGLEIPEDCTIPKLLDIVTPKAANILVDGIRKGLFVQPLQDVGWRQSGTDEPLLHAGKIRPEDRHVDWANWTWAEISRRSRVVGPLWSNALVASGDSTGVQSLQQRRVILTEIEKVESTTDPRTFGAVPGTPFVDGIPPFEPRQGKGLYVSTQDGSLLRVHQMKVEGEPTADAFTAALKARMVGDRTFSSGASQYTSFYEPLR
ncbi:methionyl-tRNA formyltransferase [Aspergillus melleus]|uniref:methionyl-tRNA formyltransferase n=1 Tax=Aspergillus melleus TaxID=138277 RepID=UPI001E8CD219|nr:Methionyl-tRNA formyltransferase [Aspergillus melleus]KAH8422874.1 Methionyl-tRNA formyltransferase [Aspergillus melleus]